MKITVDVDELEREGVLSPELAAKMRQIAMRDTGSTAINIVLAFGAIAVAAGLLALFQSGPLGALLGLGFYGRRLYRRARVYPTMGQARPDLDDRRRAAARGFLRALD